MKKTLILLAAFAAVFSLCILPAGGDNKKDILPVVMGHVRSTEGYPLSAEIKVKKGKQKTTTDDKGNFMLFEVPADAKLIITYEKVKTEISLDGRSKIKLTLVDPIGKMRGSSKPGSIDTGLGKVNRDDYAGSVSELTAEDIEKGGFTNLVDAMRAKLGGITITDEGYITMRGINTFNGSVYALIMLDGTEIDSVLDVEARDVEHVSVLKEGDMYGQRGANGVVIITTKH